MTVTADDLLWLAKSRREEAECIMEWRTLRKAMSRDEINDLLRRNLRLARWLEEQAAEMARCESSPDR